MIARLRVEHQQWDEGMKKARKGVDDLQKSTGGMDAVMGKAMKSVGAMAATWLSAEAAGKAFNKTIAGSQTLTDEWGRTMQATTRVVDSFFESLAQGSFQSFLSGLDNTIAKAREAYDAIDALGTYDIFAGPLKAKYEAQIRQLKYEIRAGVGNADEKKAEIRTIEEKMLGLANRESSLSGSAASKLLASFSNSRGGMDLLEELFLSGDQAQNVALAKYEELKRKYSSTREYEKAIGTTSFGGTIMGTGSVITWADEEVRAQAEALKAFGEMSDEKLQEVANLFVRQYKAQADVYAKKMENLETLRYQGPGGSAGKKAEYVVPKFEEADLDKLKFGVTTAMSELENQLQVWQARLKDATTAEAAAMAEQAIASIQARIDAQPIALRLNIPEEDIANIQAQMQSLSDRIRKDVSKIDTSKLFQGMDSTPVARVNADLIKTSENLGKVSNAFGMMGQTMQQLEDPSAKVAGIIMEAIANVASSFAMALASEKNVWTWIAAAISGTATMISTITAIKSVTSGSYAEGGIVSGHSYAGDAVPIMANAGEVILNASQQNNVASQLQRDSAPERQPYVTGETMYLGLNNYLRRSGRGDIVTSRS